MKLPVYKNLFGEDDKKKGPDGNPLKFESLHSLPEIVEWIRTGPNGLDERTADARALLASGQKAAYDSSKKRLPCFVISGQYNCIPAKNEKLKQHSGMLVIDFDNVKDAAALRTKLAEHPSVLLAFISPSEKGVKCVVPITPTPTDSRQHTAAFKTVAPILAKYAGAKVDMGGSDMRRSCTLCHDPEVYFTETADALAWEMPKPQRKRKASQRGKLIDVLNDHGIPAVDKGSYGEGTKYWVDCPWKRDDHKPGSSYVIDGDTWVFKCAHDSCSDKTIKDFAAHHGFSIRKTIPIAPPKGTDKDTVCLTDIVDNRITPRYEKIKADAVHRVLLAQNKPETLFRSGSTLQSIDIAESPPQAVPLVGPALATAIGRTVMLREHVKADDMFITQPVGKVPPEISRHLEHRPDLILEYPELQGICTHPIFWKGEVINENGYHAPSRTYIHLPKPLTLYPVDVKGVHNSLNDIYQDFTFASDADKTNELAFVLTILMKHELGEAATPLFLRQASIHGIGKSYLHNASALIATGHRSRKSQMADDKDELRKFLLPLLQSKQEIVYFDNVSGYSQVDSGNLATAISEGSYQDRVLGSSTMSHIATTHVNWAASGNGIRLTDELFDRSVTVRLDQQQERLEDREFKYDDLHNKIREDRDWLFSAFAAMYQTWYAKKDEDKDGRVCHRFGHWSKVISGILEPYGFGELNGNADRERNRALPNDDPMNAFFSAIYERFKESPWRIADVKTIAFSDEDIDSEGGYLDETFYGSDREKSQKLSIRLRRTEIGRIRNGLRLVDGGIGSGGRKCFCLKPIDGS